jgi:hypothetical protein
MALHFCERYKSVFLFLIWVLILVDFSAG